MQFGTRVLSTVALLGVLAGPCLADQLSYTNSSGATIVDEDVVTYTIAVPDSFIIDDLKILITLVHTDLGDIDLTLTSPGGQTIDLWTQRCDNESNPFAILSDEGIDLDCDDTEPSTPILVPRDASSQIALARFDGSDAQGDWVFSIQDNVAFDTGTFWAMLLFHADHTTPKLGIIETKVETVSSNIDSLGLQLTGIEVDTDKIPMIKAQVTQLQTDLTMVKNDVASILSSQADQQLLEMEENLLAKRLLVTYFTPNAQGGLLDTIRALVVSRITQATGIGESTHGAGNQVAIGDSFAVNAQYKDALRRYATALCLTASRTNEVSRCYQ